MFSSVSIAVKRRAPALHNLLKSAYRWSNLPAIKSLNRNLTFVAPELVGHSPTEPHVLRWIDSLLRRGDTFFDVGAHYGWMSLAACHRVAVKGRVVAFEPSPRLVGFLQCHKRLNRFEQMEIVEKAVADSDEEAVPFHLLDGGESFMNSLVDHRIEAATTLARRGSTIQVQTTTLDRYCRESGLYPAAVKIDVEGAELLVLQGCHGLLTDRRAAFIVATHPTWLPQGQRVEEIFELFRNHEYLVAASEVVQYEGADFGDYVFLPSEAIGRLEL